MLLLLFSSSSQGVLVWYGPHPNRTVLIEPETRIAKIT